LLPSDQIVVGKPPLTLIQFTRVALERIFHFAFQTAASRPKKHLTMVTKSNAQRHGMVLWDKVFYEIASQVSLVYVPFTLSGPLSAAINSAMNILVYHHD
jgi:isocitrate/isopropylmalate dehydrogenase